MQPPLRGVFSQQDYDLTLAFDIEHFERNEAILDRLKVGSDVEFTGFVRNLGSFTYKPVANHSAESKGEKRMPMFVVFDISIIKEEDEIAVGWNRESHHHVHKDGRYKVTNP